MTLVASHHRVGESSAPHQAVRSFGFVHFGRSSIFRNIRHRARIIQTLSFFRLSSRAALSTSSFSTPTLDYCALRCTPLHEAPLALLYRRHATLRLSHQHVPPQEGQHGLPARPSLDHLSCHSWIWPPRMLRLRHLPVLQQCARGLAIPLQPVSRTRRIHARSEGTQLVQTTQVGNKGSVLPPATRSCAHESKCQQHHVWVIKEHNHPLQIDAVHRCE